MAILVKQTPFKCRFYKISSSYMLRSGFATHILLDQYGKRVPDSTIKRMSAVDLVFDRTRPRYLGDKIKTMTKVPLISNLWYRQKVKEMYDQLSISYRISQIRGMDGNFDARSIASNCFTCLRQINSGIILGAYELIENSCITPLCEKFEHIKGTSPVYVPDDMTLSSSFKKTMPFIGRITKLKENPTFVDANVIYVSSRSRSLCFGQLIFRILTEQVLVYEDDPLLKEYEPKDNNILFRKFDEILEPNTWYSAFTENGSRYYFNPRTGKVSWKQPASYRTIRTHYDPSSGTLGSGRILQKLSHSRAIVENYVTLQKPLFQKETDWLVSDF